MGSAAVPSVLIALVVCPDVIIRGQCRGAVQLSVSLPFSLSVGFYEF